MLPLLRKYWRLPANKTPPAQPAANTVASLYFKEVGGQPRPFYMLEDGTEIPYGESLQSLDTMDLTAYSWLELPHMGTYELYSPSGERIDEHLTLLKTGNRAWLYSPMNLKDATVFTSRYFKEHPAIKITIDIINRTEAVTNTLFWIESADSASYDIEWVDVAGNTVSTIQNGQTLTADTTVLTPTTGTANRVRFGFDHTPIDTLTQIVISTEDLDLFYGIQAESMDIFRIQGLNSLINLETVQLVGNGFTVLELPRLPNLNTLNY